MDNLISHKKLLVPIIIGLCSSSAWAGSEREISVRGVSIPNVIIIYMDDLGIGDVSAYQQGELRTPNIDELATHGLRFDNAYATSATCTPSRYGILTGRYPWRQKDAAILTGDAPLIISPKQQTLPKVLASAGYHTAVIGKWHLGLGVDRIDWNSRIAPGPNEVGFDYSFIMAATNDRIPNVFLRDGQVVGLDPENPLRVNYDENFSGEPTGIDNPELLTTMTFSNGHYQSINNGVSRIGFQKGGQEANWVDEEMSDIFLAEATNYVVKHQSESFFLYYALHQPHVPRIPNKRFVGLSGLGPRGDAILEADWAIGELMDTLRQLDLLDKTLIVFTSDNGPVLDDGYHDDAVKLNGDHRPWGNQRGGKYSLFDAGTHIPFVVRWNGTVKPGVSTALISQVDLLSSFADLVDESVAPEDSQNVLTALLGASKSGRTSLVFEGRSGQTAYREGNWVLIPAYWGEALYEKVDIETGRCSCYQLYDLSVDPGQQKNLASEMPNRVKEMLGQYRAVLERRELSVGNHTANN